MGLTKIKDRSRATDYWSVHSQLNKVQMHIYPVTTSKKPVVKVIVMSSRCLQPPPSVISFVFAMYTSTFIRPGASPLHQSPIPS